MFEQAHSHDEQAEAAGDLGQAAFLEIIGSLREEVQCMGTDVREVLKENQMLKAEVSRLKRNRSAKRPTAESRRIKRDCLEGLERLQELASTTRRRSRRPRSADTLDALEAASSSSWMKKMMMVMMLAELV